MSTFYAQKRSESDFMFKNHMIDWIFDSNEDACDKKIEYQQFISSNKNLTGLNLRNTNSIRSQLYLHFHYLLYKF